MQALLPASIRASHWASCGSLCWAALRWRCGMAACESGIMLTKVSWLYWSGHHLTLTVAMVQTSNSISHAAWGCEQLSFQETACTISISGCTHLTKALHAALCLHCTQKSVMPPAGGNVITALFASLLAGFALGQASPIIQFFVAGGLASSCTPGAADSGTVATTEADGLASTLKPVPAVDGNFAVNIR